MLFLQIADSKIIRFTTSLFSHGYNGSNGFSFALVKKGLKGSKKKRFFAFFS